MGKTTNQKLKILYIMKYLTDNTDEDHAVSMNDIITMLAGYGITAERKGIYDDIEMLKLFGLDILHRRSEPKGYYIASRDFELPELKLLVDAVQSSKFITEKKSRELIKKIEGLAGRYQASELQSQVVVTDRIKTMNESIYYNVDKIHSAISQNLKICFKYCEWTVDKRLQPKKNGENYNVSPWVLTWDNENYYLIAYDEGSREIRHYRVDKMLYIEFVNEPRSGKECFESFDIAMFSKKTFGMFAGNERDIDVQFTDKLIGVVIDRFGKDTRIHKNSNKSFIAHLRVNISAQFYGWIFALGSDAKIIAPAEETEKYIEYINKITALYTKSV